MEYFSGKLEIFYVDFHIDLTDDQISTCAGLGCYANDHSQCYRTEYNGSITSEIKSKIIDIEDFEIDGKLKKEDYVFIYNRFNDYMDDDTFRYAIYTDFKTNTKHYISYDKMMKIQNGF